VPKVATVLVVGLLQSAALDQWIPSEEAVQALESVRSLKCSFPSYASVDWDEDEPALTTGTQEFAFHIDSIDRAERSARMIGNAGSTDLAVAPSEDVVTFVELVPAGTLNLTTVYAWLDGSGRLKAVHSRHTAMGGPSPSQAYGTCEVWQ
jgi:hypothetical protein